MYASTPSGTVGPEEMVGRIVARLWGAGWLRPLEIYVNSSNGEPHFEGGPSSHEKAIELHKEAGRRLLNALQYGDLSAEFEGTGARRRAISMNFWQTGEGLVSFDQRRLIERPGGVIFFVDGVRFAAWLESFAEVPNTNQADPPELSGESALVASASPVALAEVAASEPEAAQPIPDEAPTPISSTEPSDQPGPKPGNRPPLKTYAIPIAIKILDGPNRPPNKRGWRADLARQVQQALAAQQGRNYQTPSIERVFRDHKDEVAHPDPVEPRPARRKRMAKADGKSG